MKKFNIGDKVVPISKSVCGSLGNSNVWRRAQENKQGFIFVNHYEVNGDVTCNDELVDYNSGDYFLESDLVLYSENTTNVIKAQKLINSLENLVGEANAVVEALKDYQTQETKHEPVAETVVETTNARQEIVGEAKAFVEKYRAVKSGDSSHEVGNTTAQEHWYETEFVQKGNKITAIVHHLNFGITRRSNKPERIGRAKCAPDNVFNQHIGEAIALGRALGINVDKFINAVQPTEFLVGQIIEGSTDRTSKIHFNQTCYGVDGNRVFNYEGRLGWLHKPYTKIIDDTNAQYKGTK